MLTRFSTKTLVLYSLMSMSNIIDIVLVLEIAMHLDFAKKWFAMLLETYTAEAMIFCGHVEWTYNTKVLIGVFNCLAFVHLC